MKLRAFLVIAALAAFTIYSAMVIANHGYAGFVDQVALAGGWGTQVFLDLVIALVLFVSWMLGDARKHGIPAWPYFVAILFTGSIGALAYLAHRTLKRANTPTPQAATA